MPSEYVGLLCLFRCVLPFNSILLIAGDLRIDEPCQGNGSPQMLQALISSLKMKLKISSRDEMHLNASLTDFVIYEGKCEGRE